MTLIVSRDSDAVLIGGPLGAGLGVAMYDPDIRAGGLLHALLPDSRSVPSATANRPEMYLDTGLPALFGGLQEIGAKPERLIIYAAGGGKIMDDSPEFNLGGQMRDALDAWLSSNGLKLHAADIGGSKNRVLRLDIADGECRVGIVAGQEEQVLCMA